MIGTLLVFQIAVTGQEVDRLERVELEQIDPRIDHQVDLAADLALQMEHSEDALQPSADVRQLYSLRGMGRPMFARRSGGLTAVFPRAWIQRGENGQFYTPIPDGTTFYIGPVDPRRVGGLMGQLVRTDAPQVQRSVNGRLGQQTFPKPLQSRVTLQSATAIMDLRLSRWSPMVRTHQSLSRGPKAQRLEQLIFQASQARRFRQLAGDDHHHRRNQNNEAASPAIPFFDSPAPHLTPKPVSGTHQNQPAVPLEKEAAPRGNPDKEDGSQFES